MSKTFNYPYYLLSTKTLPSRSTTSKEKGPIGGSPTDNGTNRCGQRNYRRYDRFWHFCFAN